MRPRRLLITSCSASIHSWTIQAGSPSLSPRLTRRRRIRSRLVKIHSSHSQEPVTKETQARQVRQARHSPTQLDSAHTWSLSRSPRQPPTAGPDTRHQCQVYQADSGPTVARQWPDSARQGPTPRQSGLKDTGPAVRHVRHPRHLRHARHSDTRHSDTLRHDPRVSTVQPPSDTGQTQARHLRHRRHQCQSTPLRHCSDTTPTPPTPPTLRHIRAQAPSRGCEGPYRRRPRLEAP